MIAPAMTVRRAFDLYYRNYALETRESTFQRYRWEIGRWERHTRNPSITEITHEDFIAYRRSCLSAGLAAATIESGLRVVRQVLRLCGPKTDVTPHALGILADFPYTGRKLKVRRKPPVMPTLDELGALYLATDVATWPRLHLPPSHFWRCWIVANYFLALRLSDMRALTWDCVGESFVRFTAQKTRRTQEIPVHRVLADHLQRLRSDEPRVFPVSNAPQIIRRELRLISKAAGIRTVTPQQLRRLGVTEWSAANSDAGKLVHGCGLEIRDYYVDVRRVLSEACGRLAYPPEFKRKFDDRQRRLF